MVLFFFFSFKGWLPRKNRGRPTGVTGVHLSGEGGKLGPDGKASQPWTFGY